MTDSWVEINDRNELPSTRIRSSVPYVAVPGILKMMSLIRSCTFDEPPARDVATRAVSLQIFYAYVGLYVTWIAFGVETMGR